MNEAKNIVKMMQPTEQKIGRNTFYIYPLPAFTAANLSTEIIGLLSPLVGGIAGAFKESDSKDRNLMDMDISEAAPYIAGAFSSLSADKTEYLLRKLLLNGKVAVMPEGSQEAFYLDEDTCDNLFCGNTQDMFILAFYVIKENYKDFFGSFGNLSGNAKEALKQMLFPDTEPSMEAGSVS